jgi:hypothetical protein
MASGSCVNVFYRGRLPASRHEAVRYLEMRRLLERHPERNTCVRVLPTLSDWVANR